MKLIYITVTRSIPAPVEDVFDVRIDPGAFSLFL